MTHADLVELGRKWLLRSSYSSHDMKRHSRMGCSVVLTEVTSHAFETPDVLGWSNVSILIECKASRADFLADQRKEFRKDPTKGMGDLRYYLAPDGLLKEEEIPQSWGFLEAYKKLPPRRGYEIRMRKESAIHECAYSAETAVLLSLLRGLDIHSGDHTTIKAYMFPAKTKRATLSMKAAI